MVEDYLKYAMNEVVAMGILFALASAMFVVANYVATIREAGK